MKKAKRIVQIAFIFILFLFFVVSVVDTHEKKHKTNFNQDNIMNHIKELSKNGPRSIADKENNQKALDYIVSELRDYGVVNGDLVDHPAYLIQDFVAIDPDYQNWNLKNIIVHIPATTSSRTDEAIMFMGHTDSVPMGDGSSDDGVAVAVMLEAINYYIDKINNGYTISNDLVFCFVNGEEYGLYGSYAFMNEFKGFNNVVQRIKFGTNLESRGTSGTLIMFETAKNNYNTIKLFSKINKNIFTCSIATMIYDMMPNGTDFSNFKEYYQGLNFANITGGENYHTQNDNVENVGSAYLSQQAQIVDSIIDKLANYGLRSLYDAKESAIFFSYLDITTVVYNHTASIIIGVITLLLMITNIVLAIVYKKENNIKKTTIALLSIIVGFIISALLTYICYFIFQLLAALFGTIDIHMVGTITYSNTAIVIGIGILALAVSAVVSYFSCKWLKIDSRSLNRGFAYIHAFLGVVLTFVLPDASYLFVFSGLFFIINEVLISAIKKVEINDFHFELLITALYFPIVMPVIVLATSALGLTMAYVYGLVFAISIYSVGIYLAPYLKYVSFRRLYQFIRKKELNTTNFEGSLHILGVALMIFLIVAMIHPNASVNLQGKQNLAKLPYDDALVYSINEDDSREYRIYDLNAYNYLNDYSSKMKYNGSYYSCKAEVIEVEHNILSTATDNKLTIKKCDSRSLIYLKITNINANTFIINDGASEQTYVLVGEDSYSITIHSDCVLTIDGSVDIEYTEVIRDYEALIPSNYNSKQKLHFNLWLNNKYSI